MFVTTGNWLYELAVTDGDTVLDHYVSVLGAEGWQVVERTPGVAFVDFTTYRLRMNRNNDTERMVIFVTQYEGSTQVEIHAG